MEQYSIIKVLTREDLANDFFALGATLFYVLNDRKRPFLYDNLGKQYLEEVKNEWDWQGDDSTVDEIIIEIVDIMLTEKLTASKFLSKYNLKLNYNPGRLSGV